MSFPSRLLSASSTARFLAVIAAVSGQPPTENPGLKVALLDGDHDDALAALDLDKREIRPSASEVFDFIFVEQRRSGHRRDLDFLAFKSRLSPDGAILLRRRGGRARWWGRLRSRRRDDNMQGVFGGGHDRREAALRRASLYLTTVSIGVGSGQEEWLVATTHPRSDDRYRDQIGRVATDYLRR